MQDIRLAIVQCSSAGVGEPETNLAKMDAMLATAGVADLVAFPEVSLSGYVTDQASARERAFGLGDDLVRAAIALTETHRTYAAFGCFEAAGDDIYNSYVLAGHGALIGVHRKVHTPARERSIFTPGSEFSVFPLPFANVGLSICYDNEIPESHLVLACRGAELILMPTAWADHWEREDYIEPCRTDAAVVAERERWMRMMFGARCRDTGTYSALINQVGPETGGPWRFVGKSMAFAPTGRVVAEACAWDEEILYADLDGSLLHAYREMPCYAMKNRRPATYGPLTKPQEGPPDERG